MWETVVSLPLDVPGCRHRDTIMGYHDRIRPSPNQEPAQRGQATLHGCLVCLSFIRCLPRSLPCGVSENCIITLDACSPSMDKVRGVVQLPHRRLARHGMAY